MAAFSDLQRKTRPSATRLAMCAKKLTVERFWSEWRLVKDKIRSAGGTKKKKQRQKVPYKSFKHNSGYCDYLFPLSSLSASIWSCCQCLVCTWNFPKSNDCTVKPERALLSVNQRSYPEDDPPLQKNELWYLCVNHSRKETDPLPQCRSSSSFTVIPASHVSAMLTLLELKRSQWAKACLTWRGDFDLLVGPTSCRPPHKHLLQGNNSEGWGGW